MLVVIDFDGVLTDGKQYIDHTGEKVFKAICSRDVRALRELVAAGYDVLLLSADDWPGGSAFAERVGVRFACARDKLTAAQAEGYEADKVIAVGDDAWDRRLLEWAGTRYCPADAEQEIRSLTGMRVTIAEGGRGVIADMVWELVAA